MPVDERYRRQVELLVRTLPRVAKERCFALKSPFNVTCKPSVSGEGVRHEGPARRAHRP